MGWRLTLLLYVHSLPPSPNSSGLTSNWVLNEVKEIQEHVGISCEGLEEQFRALHIAMKMGHSLASKSASKRDTELRRFTCSINYHMKDRSGVRRKIEGEGSSSFL